MAVSLESIRGAVQKLRDVGQRFRELEDGCQQDARAVSTFLANHMLR